MGSGDADIQGGFEVKSQLVLAADQNPLEITSPDQGLEIVLRNAPPDDDGHAPGLVAKVVGPAEKIEDVATQLRSILADQLDILTFVTHARMQIERCFRVMEWDAGKKTRATHVLKTFDPDHPPVPNFPGVVMPAVNVIARENLPGHVRQAPKCFRLGVIGRYADEQFQQFWTAIEIMAEGEKDIAEIPVPCPTCGHALHCPQCDATPIRRPMAQEAIRALFDQIGIEDAAAVYKRLSDTRNCIMHGRDVAKLEKKHGPMPALINEAAFVAWHAILRGMVVPADGVMANLGWDFQHKEMVLRGLFEVGHTGPGDHPG